MLLEKQFNRLCEELSDDIYRYALALLGNRTDAEDICQEVLLKLWRNLPWVVLRNPRSWLLRTTRNSCLDHFRRNNKRDLSRQVDESFLLDQHDTSTPDPGRQLDMQVLDNRIRVSLGRIPEVQRSIFILLEVNQLSLKETAKILNLPVGTVKVYRQRAKENLKNIFMEESAWIRNYTT